MPADLVDGESAILRREQVLMASKSRAAQEKLAQLEKDSAPFEKQLVEAAKFIGIDLADVSRSFTQDLDSVEKSERTVYHGREEWLLRWLLKKLQAPKEYVPRKTTNSWILFCYLLRVIPSPNAARMLNERKFMTILRQALEEAEKVASAGMGANNTLDSGENKPVKASKKRKHSGELVAASSDSGKDLPVALFAAMDQIAHFTKVKSDVSEGGRTTAFSTEYMKAMIRTTAEDAAKILGKWLSLCRIFSAGQQTLDPTQMRLWLSPFIDIWESRIVGSGDLMQFSLYCSQPLLSLLKGTKAGDAITDWKDELEQLVARNIMIPAKAAKLNNTDSDLLNTLTRVSVIQDSANAPLLLEVAIRSIQTQGSRRRRPNDESWLHAVFATLKDAMPSQRVQANAKAIGEMLQSAIRYKVDLELSTLRSVTSQYGFLQGSTDWGLLATIIKLDANVFLIPNANDEDFLQVLLTRITVACIEPTWADISAQVVSGVLVPLMNAFAKARDLSAFVHHWFAQLVEFEKQRKNAHLLSMSVFGAWEDETFQIEFSKVMEASLTVTQIIQLLDWLSKQATENSHAVCVILEAIAGSITQEEVVDMVGLRVFHLIFRDSISENLDGRYKWRSWRIISRALKWITPAGLEDILILWEEHATPFESLSSRFRKGSLLEVVYGSNVELETSEALRCACAVWDTSKEGSRLESLARKPVLDILQLLAQDIKFLLRDLSSEQELGEEQCGSTLNTLYRGIGWALWSYIHCIFVEYPKVLELGSELKGIAFRELLQTVFYIACVPQDYPPSTLNVWLRNNPDAFPKLWTSMLNSEPILNNPTVMIQLIDIMLCSETNKENPLIKSTANNGFVVQCLLQLPLEVFSRKDRERIMKSWTPSSPLSSKGASDGHSGAAAAIDPAVLSLKAKIMQRPTVYEGMEYQDLLHLADALASSMIEGLDASLATFKELVRRMMSHITANIDQPRNREYISNALNHLQKKVKPKPDSKKTHKIDYALVALFEVLVGVFSAKESQLNDLGIIKSADLTIIKESFNYCLLGQLESLLAKSKKSSKSGKQAEYHLTIRSIIDALQILGIRRPEVANLLDVAKSFMTTLDKSNMDIGKCMETFISVHAPAEVGVDFGEDVSRLDGRQAIVEKVRSLITGKEDSEKIELLRSLLGKDLASRRLDNLLAVRHIVTACQDSRPSADDKPSEDSFDLSTVYSILCGQLWMATTIRQFCLICETMALMLRTKSRALNQWNIDSTLGCITKLCSRNSPHLRPTRSGTIYAHLCQLLQTLLSSHRLKLEGHFHLVVQAMQSLLRCLFTPLPHSTSKTSKLFAPSPWLSSPKHQLKASHAAAFTRLVTLICDPSVSSVTRSKQNNLTSATDKAKRMAGQHMQFVLTLYIQLQLEMRMLPEVREKMVPGLYAIFDTTTPETRRMIGDGLDSSGRAIFGTLFRNYQRFGKWKGS